MKKSSLILEEAILSFSKKVFFPVAPASFKVSYLGLPYVDPKVVEERESEARESGKKSASDFYSSEISKIKETLEAEQTNILTHINNKAEEVLEQLNDRLPDLVLEMVK